MKPTTRRSFIARAAATLTVPLWPRASVLSFQARDASRIKVRPFDLKQVRLRRGPFLDAAEVNRKYMASLDPNSLLHMFRVTAGLPSSAKQNRVSNSGLFRADSAKTRQEHQRTQMKQ